MISRQTLSTLLLLALNASAFAADNSELVKAALQSRYANGGIASVVPSETIPGWYEVATESELAYSNADASLLFVGHVVDTSTKRDLTADRWSAMHAVQFSSLPLDLAIKSVHGRGTRQLAVFADPLCPYCQQLEKVLSNVQDVTVYTFLYPLESLHPGATVQAGKIWCSPDRATTWGAWMTQQKNVAAAASCDTQAITTLLELGAKLKIDATPTLVFADGHRFGGALSEELLEKEFAAASGSSGPAKR